MWIVDMTGMYRRFHTWATHLRVARCSCVAQGVSLDDPPFSARSGARQRITPWPMRLNGTVVAFYNSSSSTAGWWLRRKMQIHSRRYVTMAKGFECCGKGWSGQRARVRGCGRVRSGEGVIRITRLRAVVRTEHVPRE